jgi:molybdopterin converting factor small subunit
MNRHTSYCRDSAYDPGLEDIVIGNRNKVAQKTMVSVKFLGMQRVVTKKDSIAIPVTGEMTVKDILESVKDLYPGLNLDEGLLFVTVNQEKASLDRPLSTDDTISFIPHISGG